MSDRLSQVINKTISLQPFVIHTFALGGVIIHQPDGGPPPIDASLSLVLIGDTEFQLTTQPILVPMEKLKPPLHVIKYGVLSLTDFSLHVIHIE